MPGNEQFVWKTETTPAISIKKKFSMKNQRLMKPLGELGQ